MSHKDGLIDSVNIYTITQSKDDIGQQKKVQTILYEDAPCRLIEDSKARNIQQTKGQFENIKDSWLIQMQAEHNGASRRDRAVVNGRTFEITKKNEIRGASQKIEYVVYYLEEKT